MSITAPSLTSVDQVRSRFRLPHWGWFLLATVVLVLGIVDLTDGVLVVVNYLNVWPPYDPGMKDGSPLISAGLGLTLATFGIWLTVRFVNRGEKPSARCCPCIMLASAVGGLSICLPIWLPYYWEQQIVETIQGCGGIVSRETDGPYWLRWLVGKDRMRKCKVFERVHGVTLFSAEVPVAGMAELNRLPDLEHLHLNFTKVKDAGPIDWRGFTILECRTLSLFLKGTTVTDDSLAQLSRLKNIRVLLLDGTAVTDLGLVHLSRLTNLQVIYLDNSTAVTDKGVEELQKALPHCKIRR